MDGQGLLPHQNILEAQEVSASNLTGGLGSMNSPLDPKPRPLLHLCWSHHVLDQQQMHHGPSSQQSELPC